jgi:hypothetical protein
VTRIRGMGFSFPGRPVGLHPEEYACERRAAHQLVAQPAAQKGGGGHDLETERERQERGSMRKARAGEGDLPGRGRFSPVSVCGPIGSGSKCIRREIGNRSHTMNTAIHSNTQLDKQQLENCTDKQLEAILLVIGSLESGRGNHALKSQGNNSNYFNENDYYNITLNNLLENIINNSSSNNNMFIDMVSNRQYTHDFIRIILTTTLMDRMELPQLALRIRRLQIIRRIEARDRVWRAEHPELTDRDIEARLEAEFAETKAARIEKADSEKLPGQRPR